MSTISRSASLPWSMASRSRSRSRTPRSTPRECSVSVSDMQPPRSVLRFRAGARCVSRARGRMRAAWRWRDAVSDLVRTLPAPAYTSAGMLGWELERFFHAGWICVGRATELPDPGDQRALTAGGQSLLMVRDGAGVLHCFYNVCRHRAHELLPLGEWGPHRFIAGRVTPWRQHSTGGFAAR